MLKPFTTQIMGILNITPDSYSDGGLYVKPVEASNRIRELLEQGADIIDIGAQATGPSSKMLPAEEELKRIKAFLDNADALDLLKTTNFSVDTYNSNVAEFALNNGATTINDISGLRYDPRMTDLIAERGADIVIMHSKESDSYPHATKQIDSSYDISDAIPEFFEKHIELALSRGIRKEQIILDPGMGMFLSSDPQVSLITTTRCSEFKLQFPEFRILYGVSRKSFISKIFGEPHLETCSKQIEISLIGQGVDIIRTHNPGLLVKMYMEESGPKVNE